MEILVNFWQFRNSKIEKFAIFNIFQSQKFIFLRDSPNFQFSIFLTNKITFLRQNLEKGKFRNFGRSLNSFQTQIFRKLAIFDEKSTFFRAKNSFFGLFLRHSPDFQFLWRKTDFLRPIFENFEILAKFWQFFNNL